MSMDDRTIPKIRTSTNFGTWNGFSVRDSLVRILVRTCTWYGTWYGFFFGTVRGTEQNSEKSKK